MDLQINRDIASLKDEEKKKGFMLIGETTEGEQSSRWTM